MNLEQMAMAGLRHLLLILLPFLMITPALTPAMLGQETTYQYIRVGNPGDAAVKTTPGYALMGGGSDLDEAFSWLCGKASGGDFLILRAAGDDDYNDYVRKLCPLNSAATLIIPSKAAAIDPRVADLIRRASIIFIAGGDQARYMNWWQNTPVQDALNAHVGAGKPIGGTSAGLAVLGEYVYSAQGDAPDDDGLTSAEALANPYFHRVTVRRGFLNIPLLRNTLTDSHFAKRNRMGRTLVFLARIVQDGWSARPREIAIDEKSAVLIAADGSANVVGAGKGAYFLAVKKPPQVCSERKALTFADVVVDHVATGGEFNVKKWKTRSPDRYSLSVSAGMVSSKPAGHDEY